MIDQGRPMNLFETYRSMEEAAGRNLTELLTALNKRHGTAHQHSRWAQWEDGKRRPSAEIYADLLGHVLPRLLREAGQPAAEAARIASMCALPPRAD